MIELKFGIFDEVFFFNTATCRVESGRVAKVQVIPTGVSRDEKGEEVLDGYVVLYQMKEGNVLSEQECFASEQECREFYAGVFVG